MSLWINRIVPNQLLVLSTPLEEKMFLPLPEDCGRVMVQLMCNQILDHPLYIQNYTDFKDVPTGYVENNILTIDSSFFPPSMEGLVNLRLIISYLTKNQVADVEKYSMDLPTTTVRSVIMNPGTIVVELEGGQRFAMNRDLVFSAITQNTRQVNTPTRSKIEAATGCSDCNGPNKWKPARPVLAPKVD